MIKPALQIWAQLLIKILRLLCICLVCYHLSIVEIFFFIFFLISFNFFPCFDVYFLFALVLLFFTWLCVISFVCKTFGYIGYMNILSRLNSLWSLVTWWKQKINHVVFFISIGSLFCVLWCQLNWIEVPDVFRCLLCSVFLSDLIWVRYQTRLDLFHEFGTSPSSSQAPLY